MCDIMILLFDGFWKRNLGSTSVWRRVGRGERRESLLGSMIWLEIFCIFILLRSKFPPKKKNT